MEPLTIFITWTTYGTWLPGDPRGWRKWKAGMRQPDPLLEHWCREQMNEEAVLLDVQQREEVEAVCRRHAEIRRWKLHAISARSNHVHIAVTASERIKKVRDQFKANATRILRHLPNPVGNDKVWTRGGYIEILDTKEALDQVVLYIREGQDRTH